MTRSLPRPSPRSAQSADDRGRNAVGLAHDELRRAGDLVGDGDLRRVQLVAGGVPLAVEVDERRDAGDAERDVGRAASPGAPERVGDDHADLGAGELADRGRADAAAEASGIEREQDERVRPLRVRGVDAGRRADEPVPRLGDDERRARADDLARLAQDHLETTRIGVAGELARPLRRLDVREVDDATLDLRDRLLRDDEDVVVLEARLRARVDDERGEIVALLELRDPAERDDAQLAGQRSPVTRIPAWPL